MKPIKLTLSILLISLFAGSTAYSEPISVKDSSVVEQYESNREEFNKGKQAELERFLEQRKSVSHSEAFLAKKLQVERTEKRLIALEKKLDKKIEEQNKEKQRFQALVDKAQQKVDAEQSKINTEQGSIRSSKNYQDALKNIRFNLLVWFFPLLMGLGALSSPLASMFLPSSGLLGELSAIVYFVFFSIWGINIFIALWNKERLFMGRRKWMMGGLLIIFLAFFSAPVFAQNKIEEDKFISQLELVDKILGQSDYQRYIAILELKPQQQIKLPSLGVSGEYLRPFRMVKVDSGEYFFTLGALYLHEKRVGDAVAAIKKVNADILASASRNPVISASIKFLIDRNQTDAASTLLEGSLDKLTDVSALVDLSLFLDSKGMQASSDKILERAISVAEHYEEFKELAQVFHKNGSIEKAGDAIDRAITSTSSAISLIDLSKLASILNFPDKSSKALSRAINEASSTDQLIALSEYAVQIHNSEKSILALQKALDSAKTSRDLISIATAAIQNSHDDIIAGVNKKADGFLVDDERIELIDLYRKHNHMENAVENFEALLKSVNKNDSEKQERLLDYANLAIEREMYEQARNAIQRLARLAGKNHNSIFVRPNPSLSVVKNSPIKSSIELQLYYGLLNEQMDFNDKAEDSYISSVKRSLQGILDSYGYDTPRNLNNFYLLGRLWKALGQTQKLEVLNLVYTDIEKEILKSIRLDYEQKLLGLQRAKDKVASKTLDKEANRLAKYESQLLRRESNDLVDVQQSIERHKARLVSLKKALPLKIQELSDYRVLVKKEKSEIMLQNVGIVATVVFLLMLLCGSIYWAYMRHAKHLSSNKTFGFVAKYIETLGWLRVLAIVGVVSGLMSIIFGQLMQIFQRSSEELAKQNRQQTNAED